MKNVASRFFTFTLGTPPGIPVFTFGWKERTVFTRMLCVANYGITEDGSVITDHLGYSRRCPRPDDFYALLEDHRSLFFYHLSIALHHSHNPKGGSSYFRFLRLRSKHEDFHRQASQSVAFLSCSAHPDLVTITTAIKSFFWDITKHEELWRWEQLARWSCEDLALVQEEEGPRWPDDPHLQELWPEILTP